MRLSNDCVYSPVLCLTIELLLGVLQSVQCDVEEVSVQKQAGLCFFV